MTRLLFVDPSVRHFEKLLDGLESDIQAFVLDASGDGIEQITEAIAQLRSNHRISESLELHLISHGTPGCLYLGSSELSLDTLSAYQTQVGSWSVSELLIYGCNVAAGDAGAEFVHILKGMTGGPIFASTKVIGHPSLGGRWELDYGVQAENGRASHARIPISAKAREAYVGVLDPSEVQVAVAYDGTASFDGDDAPGNDSANDNGIVRVHDAVGFDWFYNTTATGATNPQLMSLLPEGMRWTALPPQATGANSNIYDGAAYEADGSLVVGGDGRLMIAHLPDISSTTSASVSPTATVTGEVIHGTVLDNIEVSFISDEITTPVVSVQDISLTASAAPNTNIRIESSAFRGLWDNEDGSQRGAVYQLNIGLLGDHPTRNGTDGIKGAAELESDLTFDLDLSQFGDNARLFNFIPDGSTDINRFGGDGASRNFERVNGQLAWYAWGMPAGRPGEYIALTHPTAPTDTTHATPDSGDWTATQANPGDAINVTLQNVDTSGSTFPIYDAAQGDRPLQADEKYFAAGQVFVWIPLDDVRAGNDGILGTADDGERSLTATITNFDPDDAQGINSNFGADVEDASDNSRTFTARAGVAPGVEAIYRRAGNWGVVPTATWHYAGDGAGMVGQPLEHSVHLGTNSGLEPIENVVLAGMIDNTSQKVIASTMPVGWRPGDWSWSVLREYPSTGGSVPLEHGVDYVVEFGTGGQGGDAGWSDWDEMDTATADDADTSTIWTSDPTDAGLGGSADPDTGVRDSITKYRFRLLRPLASGSHLWGSVGIEITGPSSLETAGDNPSGLTLAMFGTGTSDNHANWVNQAYNPATESGQDGDRLTLTGAVVRTDIEVVEAVPGAGNSILAGSPATFKISGTVTAPLSTGAPAQDVYVTNMLPNGLFINDPTSVYPLVTDTQPVEFWDGSQWTTTFPSSGKAYGVRWYYGDEDLNTSLPDMGYDAIIPFDAEDGTDYENIVTISSPSDLTPDSSKSASAGVVAVQGAAVNGTEITSTPLVGQGDDISFTMQVANASDTDASTLDFVNILPYDGDPAGSSIRGTIDNIAVNNLPPGIKVYVSSAPPSTIDNTDGALDGFADPGLSTDSNHIPEGTGIWQYTLDDVLNGVAGAPAISDVTALRFVEDGTVPTILPANTGLEWDIVLTPSGNAGLDNSDVYNNRFSGRVDNSVLPLPVYSPTVTSTVVEPELEVNLEVMQDPTGTNIDPTNDAHWGETLTAASGDDIYYRVQVTNTGTSNLQDINLTDFIPAGMTYVGSSASGDGDLSSFPGGWQADLAPGDTMTIVYAANGTFTSEADIPQTVNASVTDQFGQSASDSDPAVYQPNLNPDATDDAFTTDEDSSISGQVLDGSGGGTDTDPGNDPLTVSAINGDTTAIGSQITLPSGALLTMNGDGTFDYDPNGQFEGLTSPGIDTFTYTIADGDGGFDTATVTINIDPINDAPSFGNLGGPLNITEGDAPTPLDADAILADPELDQLDNWDGAVLTLERQGGANSEDVFTLPTTTIGSVTTNANGQLVFTFNNTADQASVDAFLQQIAYSNSSSMPPATLDIVYTINDGNTGTQGSGGDLEATGTVTVNIDRLPEAFDDAFNAVEDLPVTGDLLANNGNGVDDLGDPSSTFSGPTTSVNGGTVTVNPDGTFSYQPAPNFVGTDTFTYTITDADGDTSTAVATFNVQRDTDGDGVPDVADLDDDNDGILDTVELGGLDPNQDSDGDGTADWQDADSAGFTDANGDGIDDRFDPDGDGKPNHLDIDADNDGIPDNVEAQTTVDYIAPSGIGSGITDSNNDGLDDAYDSATPAGSTSGATGQGLSPVNSDGGATTSDSTPDYLDSDSDNDGTPDIQENGMGNVATPGDTDGDGLLDVFEAGTVSDGFDVNDSLDAPANSALPDSDGDVPASGAGATPLSTDLDYREDTPPVLDLDNDSGTTNDADYSDSFIENGSPVGLTDGSATITDVDSTTFTQLKLTVGGVADGASEVLLINGTAILLDNSATPATVTVGGIIYGVSFVGNDITFTLSGGGNIPEVDAEALLNAIQYENRSEVPTTAGDRTFTFSTNDGNSDSNLATTTIVVDAVPDAVNDAFSGPEDTDITGNVFADNGGGSTDDLGDVPGTTVTIASPADEPSNGSVVINDDGTFTYTPNPEFNGTDSFTYTVTDADGDISTAVVNLTIDPINDAPTVTGLADPLTYSENSAPVVLDGDALLADIDLDGFNNWDGAVLTIERQSGAAVEDVFGESGTLGVLTEGTSLVVGGTTIGTVETNSNGILELKFNSNATAALVDSAVQQITYQNTSDDPLAAVALNYTLSDGNNGNQGTNPAPDGTSTPLIATATKTINIVRENDKPVLTAGDTLTYTENTPAQVVDGTVTLADPDDTEIASGSVTLSNGFTPGDLLAVDTTGTNITASYDPATGVLTLSGTDTLANYQAVMQAVTFASNSDDPTTISNTREVTWEVVDANSDGLGAATSIPVTSSITVIPVNDPPVLELDGDDSSGATGADYQTLFVPGNGAVAIADATDTGITDLDDSTLTSATITLTDLPNGADESLSLTGAALAAANAAGITGISYDSATGVLTLTGAASLADYEAAIAAITYNNVAAIPDRGDRTITVVVQDAGGDTTTPASSNIATTTIRFDSDGDGVADSLDLDDDNDGIPDVVELGSLDPDLDTDGDGSADWQDPDAPGFTDANGDGIDDRFDTDGDGIIDSLDVDADNDGITDVIEAGGTDTDGDGRIDGFTDTDGDGLADSVDDVDSGSGTGEVTTGTPLAPPNTDGTGRPDFQDIDADDDGIPDNVEAQSTANYQPPAQNDGDGDGLDDQYDPDFAGSTPITTPENTDGVDNPDYLDEDSDNDGLTDLQENGDSDGLANSDADGDGLDDNFDDVVGPDANDEMDNPSASTLPDSDSDLGSGGDLDYRDVTDTDDDGVPDPIDLDDDNDGIPDTVELGITDLTTDSDNDGIPDSIDVDQVGGTDANGDGVDDSFDTDGDGIIDSLDVDADNDGITDAIEAGSTDVDGDGRIDGFTDADGDGLADSVDDVNSGSGAGEVTTGTPLVPPNTDGTGNPDYQDIDADDDGIPDNVEAQSTDGYVPPAETDVDGDGLDDAYDPDLVGSTPITTPENTDGTDNPDYLDEDSDNDGLSDLQENGDPDGLSGSDSDGDGLDDNFDDVAGPDVNDDMNAPATDLPDTDGSEDVNYRDREDTDNDNVPDPIDLDDDNDGILDSVELGGLDPNLDSDGDGTPDWQDSDTAGFIDANSDGIDDRMDADGDGKPNHLDIDADNDGIPDQVEAQTTADYIPPSGVEAGITDANGDGLDDAYGATGLTPVDTDAPLTTADGIPDYLDSDSDNDGLTDLAENGFGVTTPGVTDTDGDGLLDDFEADINDGFVVNGNISDPNPTTLPDTDGDTAADGNDASPLTSDLDYRDNTAEVTITANDPAAAEPTGSNDGQFTVTLSQPSAVDTTVTYSITGDATNGSDYGNLTGTVIIPAGATSVEIDVAVLDDNVLEDDELVTLTLQTASNPNATVNIGADDTATVTISDEDVAEVEIAAVADATEPETDGQFVITLTQPSDTDTTVTYSVTGDATPGSDYETLSGTLIIPAGETSVPLDVTILDDILVEDDETVTVTLDSVSGDSDISIGANNSDTVTVSDDDAVLVSVVASDPLAAEPDNNGQYTISIEQPSDTDTVLEYSITGTATGGDDYDPTPLTGTITIPAGETSVMLDVPVLEDSLSEPDETVVLTLDAITSGDADIRIDETQNEATVTILADTDGDNIPDVDDFDDDNDGILDTVEENGVPGRDTDGDGIPDSRDLDADNDGINDIVEAGHGADDLDNDGIVDGPVGTDGVPNAVQSDPDGETVNYTPLNSDNDPNPDFQDLDSDNDSLPDLYEGGSGGADSNGDGVIDPGPDSDNDGIQDSVDGNPTGYGDSNSPETPDSDGDNNPDYLDTDSDGDGVDDIDEASNGDLDGDNDGMVDDPTDNDADGIPDVIDDSDLDGTPDADPTEMDPQAYGGLPLVDTDGDGVPDIEDLDDDNDGILDTVEELGDPDRDTDGDGILDRLDLDSDNDGITDLTESQSNGPDSNGDGIVDGPVGTDGVPDQLQDDPDGGTTNYGDPVDSDGDGQRDFQDLDSDNDSISDLSEGGSGGADANGDGVIDGPDSDGDGIQDSVDGNPNGFGDDNNPALPNQDGDLTPDYLDIDSDGDGVPDIIEAGNGILDPNGDGVIDNPTDVDGDGIPDVLDDSDADGTPDINDPDAPTFGGVPSPGPDADGDGIPNDIDLDDDNDGIPDTVEEATAGPNGDTDSDGIPDRLDLDADNDGISDVVEAGHGQADSDGDGMVDGPVGTDGIPDAVQDDPNGGTTNYSPLNSDSDGQPNFQDLDSDNDGLSDLYESGSGGADADDNGVVDGPDTDGDGLQDSVDGNPSGYGDSNSPALNNEDGDAEPDYIDRDSDNNGRNDVSPSLDSNGDGEIDDVTDNDNDGIADIIDDSDLDGEPDPTDPDDQRYGGLPATDTDGDGVPDSRDLDDDNDGILDTDEGDGGLDTDGDGVPDSLDLDADNDGILDVTEAGHGESDSDGDGRVDGPAGDNGLPDAVETSPESDIPAVPPIDTDGDGTPDFQDLDSDNDGINDVIESGGNDPDGDGIVGTGSPVDVDEDGILDVVDPSEGGTPSPVFDTDNDSIPDYRDTDSDNDGTDDVVESGNGDLDSDGDGRIDGPDSDGDGIVDPVDPADGFGDVSGNPLSGSGEASTGGLPDTNGDGVPDYRQPGLSQVPAGSGGADEITGGNGDDILNGLSDRDALTGEGGDDIINAGSDPDTADGGADDDIINAGSDSDQVTTGTGNDIANGGSGDDIINASAGNDIANGGSGSDIIDGGAGDDILNGGSGDDVILGNAGVDLLRGSRGNDILVGGDGADLLTGGQGNDVFAYRSVSEFGDMTMDFEIIRDRIDLSAIFNGNASLGSNVQVQQLGAHSIVLADAGAGLQQVTMLLNVNANTLDANNFIL